MSPQELEQTLNAFDPAARRTALSELASRFGRSLPPEGANVNLHAHSFFSYHSAGHSPTRIAWEMRKAGLYAAGLCDFDVLDGMEEFLDAGLRLGLRVTANLETRAFLREFARAEINSPGEPGVTYIMGAGFAAPIAAGSPQAAGLTGYRDRARERNVALVARINAQLAELAVDYDRDVLPLTPANAATERHIISAYLARVKAVHGPGEGAARCLAVLLSKPAEECARLLNDVPTLEELLRAKLVKRGGIGYEPPSETTFPPADEFIRWVLSCEAIPMITWLDGTSEGEKKPQAMIECLTAKGAAALNIIPDRNWNISDPRARSLKVAKLKEMVDAAEMARLPINIGTELNKLGQPLFDNLNGEALRPFRDPFLRGARIMVGHSLLLRYAGYSYAGAAARADFADVRSRNAFFERVGARPPMTLEQAARLQEMGPAKALEWFRDRAKRG